jgi:NAD(P)-dependent dehydrogenase (short-subunit alcohol dehydrogenase family)
VVFALTDKVAVVTGAGSGIGKASALLMAKAGAQIGALSDTEAEVRRTAETIVSAGGRAIPLVADVSNAEHVRQAVEALVAEFGRLDIVFANAGINGVWAPIDELQPDEWDRTINVNLRGTYLTLHFAVPHLRRAQAGSIVITSSINGTRTFTSAGATAYSCTKAAQLAMTKMLALELARDGIRVNVVCPGAIETEIAKNTSRRDTEQAQIQVEYPEGKIPLTRGRSGTSDEVAELVLFLVSERSRHVTGTPVWIDGGQSLLV